MHKLRSENNFWYKCLKPNCRSTFKVQYDLEQHMRIHNNELDQCQYCPYRYVKPSDYRNHLCKHFRTAQYKCDECSLSFSSRNSLIQHLSIHEGIIYSCLICKKYETARKNTMAQHLRSKHSDVLGKNIHWDSVEEYVKLK